MFDLAYILLAVFAISFLIFIHELGHYFMAHRVGMRVETFAIGFGKPLVAWNWGNERWQIGWILFGGYVKIAGMDEEPNRDPYTIPDGFFGKTPWDRIKVAFMGPLVNILFALFIFSFLWVDGGREKNFSEFTKKIGWVDPKSELYAFGVRPGDEITSYNDYKLKGAVDHLYAPMVSGEGLNVKGRFLDYNGSDGDEFDFTIEPYQHPMAAEEGRLTTGVLSPASYVIYDRLSNGQENPLIEGSPLEDSGIEYGDRIVWVDGELIFSIPQLNQIINDNRAFLTIQRDGEVILRRAPRVKVQELRLDGQFREELTDWQFEAGLNATKLRELWMVPYDLDDNATVQGRIRFLDQEDEAESFPKHLYSNMEEPLKAGDRILAVDGTAVDTSHAALKELQTNRINIIVERDDQSVSKISWLDADSDFDQQIDWSSIQALAQSIGTGNRITQDGDFVLLRPVTPLPLSKFDLPEDKQALFALDLQQKRNQIDSIEDPEQRRQMQEALDDYENRLLIGLPNIQDRKVEYNPIPTDLFASVFGEISRTLSALFTGSLSPKFVSGPVGIIQVVQTQSMVSIKEALFWMGVISLNLGVLNLLPIPMLDGGTIVFNIIELVTRRRISPKLMERLIIPFAALLIAFFVFVTYNDVSRIVGSFWR